MILNKILLKQIILIIESDDECERAEVPKKKRLIPKKGRPSKMDSKSSSQLESDLESSQSSQLSDISMKYYYDLLFIKYIFYKFFKLLL